MYGFGIFPLAPIRLQKQMEVPHAHCSLHRPSLEMTRGSNQAAISAEMTAKMTVNESQNDNQNDSQNDSRNNQESHPHIFQQHRGRLAMTSCPLIVYQQ